MDVWSHVLTRSFSELSMFFLSANFLFQLSICHLTFSLFLFVHRQSFFSAVRTFLFSMIFQRISFAKFKTEKCLLSLVRDNPWKPSSFSSVSVILPNQLRATVEIIFTPFEKKSLFYLLKAVLFTEDDDLKSWAMSYAAIHPKCLRKGGKDHFHEIW